MFKKSKTLSYRPIKYGVANSEVGDEKNPSVYHHDRQKECF